MDSIGYILFRTIFVELRSFFYKFYALETSAVSRAAFIFTAIYVVFIGYAFLKGKFQERSSEVMTSLIALPIIVNIAFNTSVYTDWVYNPIISTTMRMVDFYVNSDGGGGILYMFKEMDNAFSEIFGSINVVMDKISGWEIGAIIKVTAISIGLAILYGLVYIAFVVYLILGLVALHIFLLVGIIPMFFASFKETRFIFKTWVKSLITYALIPVFAGILMALTLNFLRKATINISNIDPSVGLFTSDVGGAFLIGGISLYLFTKISEWVNALTGGSSSGVGGLIAGVGAAGAVGAMMMNKTGMTGAAQWGKGAAVNKLDKVTGGHVSDAYRRLKGLAE